MKPREYLEIAVFCFKVVYADLRRRFFFFIYLKNWHLVLFFLLFFLEYGEILIIYEIAVYF